MSNELILIKQLPVIEERLQTIKEDVTKRVNEALSLVCTEDTIQAIKKNRAALNKEFSEWEERRKEVKKAVMSPYEKFESVYCDCITSVFKKADCDLKNRISEVEDEIKSEKKKEIEEYFYEYAKSRNIDFVGFRNTGINVTLSASKKSLKEKAKGFIDRICDDLELIKLQENKDEVLYEYKQSLNVSSAISIVINRRRVIDEELKKSRERPSALEDNADGEGEACLDAGALAPPEVNEIFDDADSVTVAFKVTTTIEKLKELKKFLNNGGYEYE